MPRDGVTGLGRAGSIGGRQDDTNLGQTWLAGELLSSQSLTTASALICISTALTACDPTAVLEKLDGAALGVFDCQRAPLDSQARRLGEVLTNELGLVPDVEDPRGLLIDRALHARSAHPVLIAAIGHEVARRAGLRSQLCFSSSGWWTALTRDGATTLVGCGNGFFNSRASKLRCACPHQLAGVVLGLLARSREQKLSVRAHELMRSLPHCNSHEHAV